jgi:hypothetical protein
MHQFGLRLLNDLPLTDKQPSREACKITIFCSFENEARVCDWRYNLGNWRRDTSRLAERWLLPLPVSSWIR